MLYHAGMHRPSVVRGILAGCCLLGAGIGAACTDTSGLVGFDEADPQARVRAAQAAGRDKDTTAIKPLIVMLDSTDPAERMVAIGALEHITGQTLGYDDTADRPARDEAVRRWRRWYEEDSGTGRGATRPSGGG